MSVTFELEAQLRTDVGKGASRRLRHANKIPAVMYGGGQDPVSLTLDHDPLLHALENEAFYSHVLTIKVDGKPNKAILRDLHRHPAKPRILHADFQRVSEKDKIHMQVPLHFLNEEIAPGVKIDGGMVTRNMSELEVTCLAKDLPEYIEVDLAELHAGHSLHISDITLPEGVESVALSYGAEHDLPVVSIQVKRGGAEEEEVEAGEAAAEGEGEGESAE
ncbi:MAG: 50S ribosomal protein L25/general stress protein Ctc [Granulosicoccaceae bacterium]|jgi:large subunit ribosomal protein L25